MNVLVVGGAGYIGSQVARDVLKSRLARPVVLDDLSTGHKNSLPAGIPLVRGSYADRSKVKKILQQYKIETVLHFGARSLVSESVKHPEMYWKANVEDGRQLLLAMQEAGVKNILLSSTASVYGKPTRRLMTENHPLKPISPYGHSKLALEQLIQEFVTKDGFSATAFRFFNVAGADSSGQIGEDHDPETHLIPNVLRHAAGETKHLSLFGDNYPTPDGTCIRDYVDVRDISRAYLMLLRKPAKSGKKLVTYNLASGHGYSNSQVIQTACEVTQQPLTVRIMPRRAGDPAVLVASARKVQRELGWKPLYDLEAMIQSAWKWHITHPKGF